MPEEEVTGATATAEEVTATTEGPDSTGSENQNSTEELARIQQQLQEFQEQLKSEAKRRAEAEEQAAGEAAARKQAEELAALEARKYKGLQRETGRKTEEMKLLQAQIANQSVTTSKLEYMEKLLNRMAEQSLSPEDREELKRQMDDEQIRRERDDYKRQLEAAKAPKQTDPTEIWETPQYKIAMFNKYLVNEFGNFDPLRLSTEEWAFGVYSTESEWLSHVRAAIQRRLDSSKKAQETPAIEDIVAKVREQVEAEFKAPLEELRTFKETSNQTIKQLEEQLAEQKRVAEELAKRQKGVDRVAGGNPEGQSSRKASKVLAEMPDESWLYSKDPAKRDAYSAAMNDKSLRDQIIAGIK